MKISICIPIYNCADFIGQALDSIFSQNTTNIEVVVFDGGSTDNTSILIKDYLAKWSNLYYHRANSRGGIDADLDRCTNYATGDYLWLFSGDDVMRPGSLDYVKGMIQSSKDVYICRHTICTKNMQILHEHPVLSDSSDIQVDFTNKDQRLTWFKRAQTTEAFFSFLSGIIVQKKKWSSGKLIAEFNGSCWAHVARLFDISKDSLTVQYVHKILLDQRGDNDSFADKGIVNRFRIAIEGYHKIANHFFGADSDEAFHIRRVIRNEFKLQSFLSAKIQTIRHPEKESRQQLDHLIKIAYQDKSIKNCLIVALYKVFPYSIFLFARFFYRGYKKYCLQHV